MEQLRTARMDFDKDLDVEMVYPLEAQKHVLVANWRSNGPTVLHCQRQLCNRTP